MGSPPVAALTSHDGQRLSTLVWPLPTILSMSSSEKVKTLSIKQECWMSQGSALKIWSPRPPESNRFYQKSIWQTDYTKPPKPIFLFPGCQYVPGSQMSSAGRDRANTMGVEKKTITIHHQCIPVASPPACPILLCLWYPPASLWLSSMLLHWLDTTILVVVDFHISYNAIENNTTTQ